MISFLILLTQIALFSPRPVAAAESNECPAIDLRSRFGRVRDQGTYMAWCSIYTSADLISEAHDLGAADPISVLDVGALYISHDEKQFYEATSKVAAETPFRPFKLKKGISKAYQVNDGVYPTERRYGNGELVTALYLNKNRLCTESRASSMDDPFPDKPKSFPERLARKDSPTMSFLEQLLISRIMKASELPEHQAFLESCQIRKSRSDSEIMKALNNLAMTRLNKDLNESCRDSKPGPNEVQLNTRMNKKDSFLQDSKAILGRERPVAINYDFCKLSENDHDFLCSHSSIVVGQKNHNGTCQLLVRNSHGENCKQYEGMKVRCEESSPGYFWVDQNLLNESVRDYFWIENEKKRFSKLNFQAKPADGW